MYRRFALSVLLSASLLPSFAGESASVPAPRKVEITAKRFEFDPAIVTLKKGEPVVLVLTSLDVPHGLRFRELGVDVKASKGQSGEVRFTPEKTGEFTGHCSVFCGAKHGTMVLKLHVIG